jgi:hypothetical protein
MKMLNARFPQCCFPNAVPHHGLRPRKIGGIAWRLQGSQKPLYINSKLLLLGRAQTETGAWRTHTGKKAVCTRSFLFISRIGKFFLYSVDFFLLLPKTTRVSRQKKGREQNWKKEKNVETRVVVVAVVVVDLRRA